MSIISIISLDQVNEPRNYENDIIEVHDDAHQFTDYELSRFEFLTVNGTKADVEAKLNQIKPIVGIALMGTDGELTFDRSAPNSGEEIEVWSVPDATPIRWYKLVEPFQRLFNVGPLTAEEKQLLETVDINHPSVDSAIKKIVKDLSVNPANNEVIKELQGETWD